MKITELIQNKLNQIKLNHSIGTYKHYYSHLAHFQKWTLKKNIIFVEEITDSIIVDYISDLKLTCENITINKRVGILKRTFIENKIDHPFLQSIKKLKETTKTFDMIEYKDLIRIRKYALSLPDNIGNNLTIKCIILLLIDTGARVNELIHIEKKNVDIDKLEILLTRTKTKENRIVYFSQKTAIEIKKILSIKTQHKYLLHHVVLDQKINYYHINYIMSDLKRKLDIDVLHAHMFRHTLASVLLENGSDIKSVMELLGHKNLETTERYLHVKKDHVKKTYMKNYNLD